METIFENTTAYDKHALLDLNRVVSRTTQKGRYRFRRIFLLTLGILGILSGVGLCLIWGELETSDQVLAVGALIIGILATAEGIFFNRVSAWNSKRMMMKGVSEVQFYFDSQEMRAEVPGREKSSYPYTAFLLAAETADYFVIMIDHRHGFVLKKDGFTKGTADEFRQFLTQILKKPVTAIR